MVAVVGGQLLYVWDALYNEQASSRDWPEIGRRLAGDWPGEMTRS